MSQRISNAIPMAVTLGKNAPTDRVRELIPKSHRLWRNGWRYCAAELPPSGAGLGPIAGARSESGPVNSGRACETLPNPVESCVSLDS